LPSRDNTDTHGIILTVIPSDINSLTPSFTADGVSGVYIWGGQIEQSSTSTSYIPTTTATVTRIADVATPLIIPSTPKGAIVRDGYVQNLSTNVGTTLFMDNTTEKLVKYDSELTQTQITNSGLTEAVWISDLTGVDSITITVSGIGIVYWGDETSDAYNGSLISLSHTYTKNHKAIKFVGTLTYINSQTSNSKLNHDIANLPSGLTYYLNYGQNTTTGDIANLPSGLTYYNNYGQNQVNKYTSGHIFSSSIYYFVNRPAPGYGLTSTMVDNLLIDLDTSGMSSGNIYLDGNNSPRTTASDAAVTSLQGKGVNVYTN
jgi:hypothetical protein